MTVTTKNWMSALSDELTLEQISMPGTHDSGSQKVSDLMKGIYQTQNFDILTQLNDGIRFLDIRVLHKKNNNSKTRLLVKTRTSRDT